MASPKIEAIFIFDPTTGVPLTGQAGSMSFDVYVTDQGGSLGAPSISEIGSTGVYKFTPVFASPSRGIVYVLNCGAGANPRRITRYMRPEDWNGDNTDVLSSSLGTSTDITSLTADIAAVKVDTQQLNDIQLGAQEVKASGGDANRLILYKPDGVTVIEKFDLADVNGDPTVSNPFKRTPV